MKRILLFTSFLFIVFVGYGQVTTGEEKYKDAVSTVSQFYKFSIPAVINGSNIDPNAISSINVSFTQTAFEAKVGLPNIYKKSENPRVTGFIGISGKPSNSVVKISNSNFRDIDYGASAGLSIITNRSIWKRKENGIVLDDTTSEAVNWIGITAKYNKDRLASFDTLASFGNIMSKNNYHTFQGFISFNRYFYSKLDSYRWRSVIYSFGAGIAALNDYQNFTPRTFESGQLYYNADSSKFQSIVETTNGVPNKITKSFAPASYFEIYYPLVKTLERPFTIYFGSRINYYAIKDYIINLNSGFYLNIKDKKPSEAGAKDIVNLSITGQFNNIIANKSRDEYFKNKFSVLIQAAIPLRFN